MKVGRVTADIELINGGDLEMVRRNLMDKDEVNRLRVTALVDTGAMMLCIVHPDHPDLAQMRI